MANVSLSTREYGGYVVIAMQGELDIVDATSVMAVLAAAAAGNPRIIVDPADLEFIDCCALGVLGRVRAQARQAGGDLLLAAPRGPVRRLQLPSPGNRWVTSASSRPVKNPRGRVTWRGAVLAGGVPCW